MEAPAWESPALDCGAVVIVIGLILVSCSDAEPSVNPLRYRLDPNMMYLLQEYQVLGHSTHQHCRYQAYQALMHAARDLGLQEVAGELAMARPVALPMGQASVEILPWNPVLSPRSAAPLAQ